MESNQNYSPAPTTSLFQMNLDAQNSYNLRNSASWGKVLGVVGIILGLVFCILCALALSQLDSYSGSSYRYRRSGLGEIFEGSSVTETKIGLWMFIITGIVFILGGLFSFNFGNKINAALKSNDQQGLNQGFAALRNYMAVRSITLILVLLLFLITIAGSL
jgi:uncharacterized membrane protein